MILNEEQKKVVYSNERFLFLLAGAGSGKTRVIVERIKYLIEIGIDPSQILAITFTRKASFEMKDRVNNSLVHIHTFHQFCDGSESAFNMARFVATKLKGESHLVTLCNIIKDT